MRLGYAIVYEKTGCDPSGLSLMLKAGECSNLREIGWQARS